MKLVIVGGSSASTPELMEALADWPGGSTRRPEMRVILWGRSRDKLATVLEACRDRAPRAGNPLSVAMMTDLGAAVRDADVVLIQARVGGLAARVFDETFPRSHGIPADETMGPGGLANALRTVRGLQGVWETIASEAPHTLVVNLTNPAGIVSAVARLRFGLCVVSVCDSPITLTDGVAQREGIAPDAARLRYCGLNHVGWWVPEPRSDLDGSPEADDPAHPARAFAGALPNPYVRFYLAPQREYERQRGAEPRGVELQRLEARLLASYGQAPMPSSDGQIPRRGAVWYRLAIVPLLDAWVNGSERVGIAGFPNDGLVEGIPRDLTVEVPFTAPEPGRLEPIGAVRLPPLAAAILASHAAFEAMTIEAIMGGARRDAIVAALWANPMIHDIDLAATLADEIIRASPD